MLKPAPHTLTDIYAISPSSAIEQPGLVVSAVRNMKRLGYAVHLDRALNARNQRFAGSDRTRLAAFDRAARHRAPIVMISRGGYGLTRLLPMLDFEKLAAAAKHWVGLSDFTAFHLAMLARAGAGTWAGPALLADFSGPFKAVDETTADSFCDAMAGQVQALGFACQGPAGVDEEGVLWGGNLEVLSSMIGTPYFPRIDGGLLFLEEVGEHPYRVERKLTQLLHAGIIDRQKAVLIGYVNRFKAVPNDRGFGWDTVLARLRSKTRTPIISGLPFGHDTPKLTLPHGARLGLSSGRKEAFLVFPQQHHQHHH